MSYPTDLTDAQYALIEPLLPPAKSNAADGGRPRTTDLRRIINGILYLNRTGCQWRMLPRSFGPWSTVHDYYRNWRRDGTWQRRGKRDRSKYAAIGPVPFSSPRYWTCPVFFAGQFVLARDQHHPDGPLVRARITRTYRRTAYALRVLTLRDTDGCEQTLRVTEEHPFHVEHESWTPAKLLVVGDVVLGDTGKLTVVANVFEPHPEGVAVYNLEVAEAHTYFVRAEARDDAQPVWVHNADYRSIRAWHDQRATDLFGVGNGRNVGGRSGRYYDKRVRDSLGTLRDIEYKSDNFSKWHWRSRQGVVDSRVGTLTTQIVKDVRLKQLRLSDPHWHFEHDPRVAPQMNDLLQRLDDAGITWSWGSKTPNL